MAFKEVKPEELDFNPFQKIGSDWMLITAGDETACNTMTASWGGAGVFWKKPVLTCYIRPQRYTKEFVDSHDTFSVSFFDPQYREALNLCGTVSGRDRDKIREAGLTPIFPDGIPAFEEADLIFLCRKFYRAPLLPEYILNKEHDAAFYPERDYHDLYIAEILKVLKKEA